MALMQNRRPHPIIVIGTPDDKKLVSFLGITHDPLNDQETMEFSEVHAVDNQFQTCGFSGKIVRNVQKVHISKIQEPTSDMQNCFNMNDTGLALLDQRKIEPGSG